MRHVKRLLSGLSGCLLCIGMGIPMHVWAKQETPSSSKESSLHAATSMALKASVRRRDEQYRSLIKTKHLYTVGVPVVYRDGLLFTTLARAGDKVYVSGSFLGWTKKVPMKHRGYGLHYAFVPIDLPKGRYTYRYLVNQIWQNDMQQVFRVSDGYGTQISAFYLSESQKRYDKSPKTNGQRKGQYLFFLKDNGYRHVSWVGNDNLWDPYTEKMTLKDGYWTLVRQMERGRTFYKYFVDGKTLLDPQNENVTRTHMGELVNYIPEVK